MSMQLTVELERGGYVREDSDGLPEYGAILPYCLDELDSLASQLGLRKPSSFISEDPEIYDEAAEFARDEEEREVFEMGAEDARQPEAWYHPEEGLQTVQGLLQYLHESEGGKGEHVLKFRRVEREKVLEDLGSIEQILSKVRAEGDRFNFKLI